MSCPEFINHELFYFWKVPPSIQAIPDVPSTQIKEGSSITLECQPNGIPFPDVSWLQNDSEIMDHTDAALFNIQLLHNNQRLHVDGANINHSGKYTCVVENSVGIAHHNFFLQVLGKTFVYVEWFPNG